MIVHLFTLYCFGYNELCALCSVIFSASTSPPGGAGVRWSSGGRISQKQRKRSKSNTPDQSGEDKAAVAAGTEKEEKPPAWYGPA